MHLLLLPGGDGTGKLFGPFLRALAGQDVLSPIVVAYPTGRPCGYRDLLPLVEQAIPAGAEFLVLGESFSGPLALLLAARRPPGLRGVVLCGSFVRNPLPWFPSWLSTLAWPIWFRVPPPRRLLRWLLLGRHRTESLCRALDDSLPTLSPAVLAARARAILTADVDAELQSCPVPLLYLAASEDRVVSRRSLTTIQRLRPDVQVATLAAPHLLLQTAPEEAVRVMRTFAEGCPSVEVPDR